MLQELAQIGTRSAPICRAKKIASWIEARMNFLCNHPGWFETFGEKKIQFLAKMLYMTSMSKTVGVNDPVMNKRDPVRIQIEEIFFSWVDRKSKRKSKYKGSSFSLMSNINQLKQVKRTSAGANRDNGVWRSRDVTQRQRGGKKSKSDVGRAGFVVWRMQNWSKRPGNFFFSFSLPSLECQNFENLHKMTGCDSISNRVRFTFDRRKPRWHWEGEILIRIVRSAWGILEDPLIDRGRRLIVCPLVQKQSADP